VGLRWKGRDLTVIATHTQPPDGWKDLGQAEQLARLAREAAPRPDQQIDQVLGTPGLTGRDQANEPVAYSDHRPIAVTLDAKPD
jgi:hypothetical protein